VLHSRVHTNIRQDWRGFQGTNTLAYYENLQITGVKSFIVWRKNEKQQPLKSSVNSRNTFFNGNESSKNNVTWSTSWFRMEEIEKKKQRKERERKK
jgi:hypothetical protein